MMRRMTIEVDDNVDDNQENDDYDFVEGGYIRVNDFNYLYIVLSLQNSFYSSLSFLLLLLLLIFVLYV